MAHSQREERAAKPGRPKRAVRRESMADSHRGDLEPPLREHECPAGGGRLVAAGGARGERNRSTERMV